MQCCLLPAHATSAIGIAIVRCAPRHRWFVCVCAFAVQYSRIFRVFTAEITVINQKSQFSQCSVQCSVT